MKTKNKRNSGLERTVTWVPIGDNSPDTFLPVLLVNARHPDEPTLFGYFDGIRYYDQIDHVALETQPTHWMELPEPPAA